MTRDELEAAIRHGLTDVVIACVKDEADTRILNDITVRLLAAADRYALDTYGITADRRAELAEAARPRKRG